MKIKYKAVNLKPASRAIVDQANEIIETYVQQGLKLTLRQLYYQFVARDALPNTDKSYDRLGRIISDARLCGLVDWEAIEDRTRDTEENSHWDDPASIIDACVRSYAIDKWEGQQYQPEVWVEKAALAGVLASVCPDLDVPFFACRGYPSQSSMWEASQRLRRYYDMNRQPVIIYLGDHDPSGIDITRDIRDRLGLFLSRHGEDCPLVERIALTMEQIEEYDPPPNPAKQTDVRFESYVEQTGVDESWELDALDPPVLVSMIRMAVEQYRNNQFWRNRVRVERQQRAQLQTVSDNWERVVELAAEEFGEAEVADDDEDDDDVHSDSTTD